MPHLLRSEGAPTTMAGTAGPPTGTWVLPEPRSIRAMGIVLAVIGALTALVVGLVGYGKTLPVAHVASRSRRIPGIPLVVWGLISDPVATKGWAGDTKTEVVEQDEPRLLVRKIVGESAYGGTWTFEIAPDGHDASTVKITERGEVYNPAFRVLSRYVFGQTRSLDTYLAKLYAALS